MPRCPHVLTVYLSILTLAYIALYRVLILPFHSCHLNAPFISALPLTLSPSSSSLFFRFPANFSSPPLLGVDRYPSASHQLRCLFIIHLLRWILLRPLISLPCTCACGNAWLFRSYAAHSGAFHHDPLSFFPLRLCSLIAVYPYHSTFHVRWAQVGTPLPCQVSFSICAILSRLGFEGSGGGTITYYFLCQLRLCLFYTVYIVKLI